MSEKFVFDEKDFEFMSWRGVRVHAIAFSPEDHELALDVDYITKSLEPAEAQNHFTYMVAPASMYFENASGIEFDLKIDNTYALAIAGIEQTYIRRTPNDKYEVWRYEIGFRHVGGIILEASGFKLFLRHNPMHSETEYLSPKRRGGISFSRVRTAP